MKKLMMITSVLVLIILSTMSSKKITATPIPKIDWFQQHDCGPFGCCSTFWTRCATGPNKTQCPNCSGTKGVFYVLDTFPCNPQ